MEDPRTKFNFLVVLTWLVKSLLLAAGSTQTRGLWVFFGLTAWPWGSVWGPRELGWCVPSVHRGFLYPNHSHSTFKIFMLFKYHFRYY